MTQLEKAQKNILTSEMEYVLKTEEVSKQKLLKKIAEGKIVILSNNKRKPAMPCAIGEGLKTKVNVNLGLSPDKDNINYELKKLKLSLKLKADTVMDLSISEDLHKLRKKILEISPIPIGTVPVYEICYKIGTNPENFINITSDDFMQVVKTQAEEGVDFMTVHCGVTKETLQVLRKSNRILDIVSRGGAIISRWIESNNKENPFYERFEEILDIIKKYDVTLSLGDGLRPGTILDATDKAQISELKVLGSLAKRAYKKGVQTIIEGPGHIPIDQIQKNIKLQKDICNGAPFYVLGPLPTDIASGYDHISGAIGATLAAYYGADFLCYLTPGEHLRLPTLKDVQNGLIATKIAAHSADIAKGIPNAIIKDREMSIARRKQDWEKQNSLSIDPDSAKKIRKKSLPKLEEACTMCSEFCALKLGKIKNKDWK